MITPKWDDLIPLREKNVDEYEPSVQEIIEYAEFIGLEFPGDQHLIYLAKEGITASLPEEWQACQTSSGDMIYRNLTTKQIQQQHPLDLIYRKKVLQLKHQPFQNYFSVQFELEKRSQALPAIEQENGDFSQSSFSDNFEVMGRVNHEKGVSEEFSQKGKKMLKSKMSSKPSKNKLKPQPQQNENKFVSKKRNENLLVDYFSKSYSSKQTNQKIPNPSDIFSKELFQESQVVFPQNQSNLISSMNNEFIESQQEKLYKKREEQMKIQNLQFELQQLNVQKQLKIRLLNQIKSSNEMKFNLIKSKLQTKERKKAKNFKTNRHNQQKLLQVN